MTELHGLLGKPSWPQPKLVAKSDESNRADQGNHIKANEYLDDPRVLEEKIEILASLIRRSKFTVAYTGAGLSKASGIPDYATKAKNSVVKAPKLLSPMDAMPTLSHYIITAMAKENMIHHYVQQNHDGLPQKSGFPQHKINEIHGAWFDPSNPVVKFGGHLRGDLFTWMEEVENQTDLCLCLGTSLSGMNADRMAETPAKKSLKQEALGTVIINLQRTSLDKICAIRIWAKLDDAFLMLSKALALPIPAKFSPPSFPSGDVFQVKYNEKGQRDPTCSMELDLRTGQKVVIAPPEACTYKKTGIVQGKDSQGHYLIVMPDRTRRLGKWWIVAALDSAVEYLPLTNISPKIKKIATTTLPPIPAQPQIQKHDEEHQDIDNTEHIRHDTESSEEEEFDDDEVDNSETPSATPVVAAAPSAPTTTTVPITTPSPIPSTPTPTPTGPHLINIIQSHRTLGEDVHQWKLKVEDTHDSISAVTWTLHPSFRQNVITKTKAPFTLSRKGWGTFTVKAKIIMKDEFGGKSIDAKHDLSFDEDGDRIKVTKVKL